MFGGPWITAYGSASNVQRDKSLHRAQAFPVASCPDRGRQSFIFHTKRHLGHIARTTHGSEFDRLSSDKTDKTDSEADCDASSAMQVH